MHLCVLIARWQSQGIFTQLPDWQLHGVLRRAKTPRWYAHHLPSNFPAAAGGWRLLPPCMQPLNPRCAVRLLLAPLASKQLVFVHLAAPAFDSQHPLCPNRIPGVPSRPRQPLQ